MWPPWGCRTKTLRRKAETLFLLSEGLVEWHSEQAKGCKSPTENQAFYRAQARGAGWKALQHTLQTLGDPAGVANFGFKLRPDPGMEMQPDHPLVLEEDQWASHTMRLLSSIMVEVYQSSLWYSHSLPGFWALLTNEDQEERDSGAPERSG